MNILVTGATRGIGKTIAQNLSGHNIFAAGRNKDLIKAYENYLVCDLALSKDLETLGKYIEENKIDVLINNAGEYIYSPIENSSYEQIEHIIKVNLEAPLYLSSKAVDRVK